MKRVRAELTQHVGGKPSAAQRILIDRCCSLSLRLCLMDREMVNTGHVTEKNGREYLCWSNALCRALVQLGLDPAKSSPPNLQAYLAAKEEPQ